MSLRSNVLALLIAVAVQPALQIAAVVVALPSLAKDGGGGSSGGSGGGGSGSSGHGSSGGQGSAGSNGAAGGGGGRTSGETGSGGPGPSSGSDDGGARHDGRDGSGRVGPGPDQDSAREAVLRGAAVPLARVMPTVRARFEGDVLDVKLRRTGAGVLVYDVTVLSKTGEYRSVSVDAKRNRVIGGGEH